MSKIADVQIRLDVITCGECGVVFGLPHWFIDGLEHTHNTFYCPNGHSRWFPGETEEQQLRKKLRAMEQRLSLSEDRASGAHRRADHTERRLAATKGVVTKMKKRVGSGVCPCCNRHFTVLERHMATKHPDFVDDAPPPRGEER